MRIIWRCKSKKPKNLYCAENLVLRPAANYVIILKSQYNQLTHTVINPVRWDRSDDHYLKNFVLHF